MTRDPVMDPKIGDTAVRKRQPQIMEIAGIARHLDGDIAYIRVFWQSARRNESSITHYEWTVEYREHRVGGSDG